MKNFTNFLAQFFAQNSEELAQMLSNCNKLAFPAKTVIPSADYNAIYFIETGVLKQFYIDNAGKEHILYFGGENWLIKNKHINNQHIQFELHIQTITPCELYIINEDFLSLQELKNPTFLSFNRKLLHAHIENLQIRILMLLATSAETRYHYFLQHYASFIHQIPQMQIASFLGITPESLSRIRHKISKSE